ncbi:uncharacterized protein LOC126592796 [Malus sylvestris]|uniref:uncharacterized protein LOC126592796 n=1 Tax=Malus sylvestris TaxID=3752 RepID=UPI0021ABF826|nr:uncharacterized protein LOC126592796 [Malus sylvestris]
MSSLKGLVPMSMAAKRVERVSASGVGEAIAVGSNWYLGFQFGGKICTGALTKWIKKWLVKIDALLASELRTVHKKVSLGPGTTWGKVSLRLEFHIHSLPHTFPELSRKTRFPESFAEPASCKLHQPPNQSSELPFKPQQSHSKTQVF